MNPKNKEDKSSLPYDNYVNSFEVPSSTECTGLMQTIPKTQEEARSYAALYDVPHPEKKKVDSLKRDDKSEEQS